MYPLSRKDNPPEMNIVDVSGVYNNTIHRMEYGFWEEVNAQIQAKPTGGLDPDLYHRAGSPGGQWVK